MSFLTRHQKMIALIAVFSFCSLIGAGSLPATTDDRLPGAVEKATSGKAEPAKKSPLVPILIGVAAAGAVAAVLVLVVFKTKYDITGAWYGRFTEDDDDDIWTATLTFTGDKKNGTLVYSLPTYTGTYAVDGKDVTFSFPTPDLIRFTGSFEDKETVSGTWVNTEETTATGTWRLTRGVQIVTTPGNGMQKRSVSPFQKR